MARSSGGAIGLPGSLTTLINAQYGAVIWMIASYDDATQARLKIEVTEVTATEVKLKVTSIAYHNGATKEETDLGETTIPIADAAAATGENRGLMLFNENNAEKPDLVSGFLVDNYLELTACKAFTITMKVDLSNAVAGDALLGMSAEPMDVPYMLVTASSTTLTFCWLAGQSCLSATMPARSGQYDHIAVTISEAALSARADLRERR